jgi:hypothetical protein
MVGMKKALGNPQRALMVAVEDVPDEDGKTTSEVVIGFAGWVVPLPRGEEVTGTETPRQPPEWPAGMDKDAALRVQETIDKFEKEYLGERGTQDYWGK